MTFLLGAVIGLLVIVVITLGSIRDELAKIRRQGARR